MRRIGYLLLGAWAILSVAALAQYLYDLQRGLDGELGVRFGWQLLILNFPGSLILTYLVPGGPVFQWCIVTLGGLVQWVYLPPTLELVQRKVALFQREDPGTTET